MIHVDIFSRELTKRQDSVLGYQRGLAITTDELRSTQMSKSVKSVGFVAAAADTDLRRRLGAGRF